MKRRAAELESQHSASPPPNPPGPVADRARPARPRATGIADYGRELEARYIAVREAWTQAMHAASSGRPADLASLAIAQEAYETVAAERERWLATGRVAIPIQPAPSRHDIEVAVGQELAWRQVHDHQARRGLLARIRRRLTGR